MQVKAIPALRPERKRNGMKKTVFVLLTMLAMLLCACKANPEPAQTVPTKPTQTAPAATAPETVPATAAPTEEPTLPATEPETLLPTEPETVPTEPETVPTEPETLPTEPELQYVNPLNGQKLEQPFTARPVAIMINNNSHAMPQIGNSEADILFEVLAEGGITRCLGIYGDPFSVPKLGPIRSTRKYYIDLALGFDAILVRYGGSQEAEQYLNALGMNQLNGLKSESYFFRDKERLESGYALEHTAFIKGSKILEYAEKKKFRLTAAENKQYGLTFDDALIEGSAANEVKIYFNLSGKPSSKTKFTRFTYNPGDRQYYAEQYGGAYIDGSDGETLHFSNVMALFATNFVQDDGLHMTVETVGSGKGYYAANGQIVPIRWSRKSETSPFSFTLEDGTPLTFTPGHTYIAVVPTKAVVNFGE